MKERADIPEVDARLELGLTLEQVQQRKEGGWDNRISRSGLPREGEIVARHVLTFFNLIFAVLAFILVTEWGSLGNLLGTAVFSVIQLVTFFIRYENHAINAYLVIAYMLVFLFTLVTWYAHKKNLLRLFSGE